MHVVARLTWRYDACAKTENLGCVNYAWVLLPYENARRWARFDIGRELTCSPNGSTCAACATQRFANRDREDDSDNAIVNHTRGHLGWDAAYNWWRGRAFALRRLRYL